MKPFLSICIIMKNEEKVLERCLDSISGIADEIVIVDTGSNDDSKKIAYRYTDKIFDFKWENDFSKARNYAASKAKGDWIFVIDADEYVDRTAFRKLKTDLVKNPPIYNIIAFQIVSFVGERGQNTSLNYHERLYRNDGTITYRRSIHEWLMHKDPAMERRGFIDFELYHSGYMSNTRKLKNKTNRNLTILLDNKCKEPIDYFYIGNEYRNLDDLDKAIYFYQKAYKLKPDFDKDWVVKLLLYLSEALHQNDRDNEAMEILLACEEIYPRLVDFKYYKGAIYFKKQLYEKARAVFEDILLQKDNLIAETSIDFMELLPLEFLGEIYEIENELQKAVQSYSKALALNEASDELWKKLISLLGKYSSLEELTAFLNDNMLNRSFMTPVRVVKILLSVPILNVQKLSRSFLDQSILSIIENEALLLKNLQLDGNEDEVSEILKGKTQQEVVLILSTRFFSVIDFILLALKTGNSEFKESLYSINYDQSLENLYNMIFMKKNRKLSLTEENLFISIYDQAKVLQDIESIKALSGKRAFLSKNTREKI
ncbi:glycosyltransferase [Sporosarcina sp. 179-K 8C2 HS]|uniref:glycosyltransferase n=1 Tax=Sporosarcina sp. 179-K 8C2 HS TaxID=3142387 RepID=UPI00399FCE35